MGRWLPAILLFGLTTLCSCAEEPDNAYPGNTQNKALKAWMTQNRPDLLENYQEEGEYYVDVVSLGDLADSAILETESWVWYDITGRDLQGNISVARDSVYALQQGTFTPYTHYVPYYQFYGELASGTFKEGTYLAMRNPLKLGETYAAQKGFPREVELRVGAEVVLYMPATIISTEANGDGGYEGQYALSANHPMIARIKLSEDRVSRLKRRASRSMILRRRTADWTRRFLRRTTIPKRLRSKPESRPRRIVGKSPRRRRLKSM